VTDFLVERFDELLNVGYTREMEKELDDVAQRQLEWHQMLRDFQGRLGPMVDGAMQAEHVKAAMEPAAYACPKCGARTAYRFGKNGRFLSCGAYPACDYAAPVDREGRPMLPERVNIKSPDNGQPMVLRTGRFGKFIAPDMPPAPKAKTRKKKGEADAPKPKGPFIINVDPKGKIKLPSPPPFITDLDCPKCQNRKLNLRSGKRGPWLGCSGFPKCRGRETWTKLPEEKQKELEKALATHDAANPGVKVFTMDGRPVESGMIASDFILPGGVQELALHAEAERERRSHAKSA
jgi:DNA topoisomerase-1